MVRRYGVLIFQVNMIIWLTVVQLGMQLDFSRSLVLSHMNHVSGFSQNS